MKNIINNKKGMSLLIVVVAISIMVILISAASVVGSTAINSANYEEYNLILSRVADNVNEYYIKTKELPLKTVNGAKQVVSADSLGSDFKRSLLEKNDIENSLYIIDMDKLKDTSIKKGSGNVTDKDIFVVAENTQNVYYLKGFKYRKNLYFGVK